MNSKSTDATDTTQDVVVVGFGFAGAHATSTLLAAGRSVVVVEPTGSHQFLTRLAAVAGGTQPLSDRAVPISEMFDVPVVAERAVDLVADGVELESGQVVKCRYTLVTAGAEPVTPPIEGLQHALALRSADDAETIRRRLDHAESVVIIGGGPTGCQLAGAIKAAQSGIAVTLVDGGERLMSNFGERLGEHARSVLAERGVDVVLNDEAAEIRNDGASLSSGRWIAGDVMWTSGYEPTMDAFGPTDNGRLVVDTHGRVHGSSSVFAAGDAAGHLDSSGEPHAMSAQIAAQAGKQVGKNLDALLAGESGKPLDLKDRGWVVDLGGGAGVAEILGVAVARPATNRLVPLMHEAIDLRNLWQLGGLDFLRRLRPGQVPDRQTESART